MKKIILLPLIITAPLWSSQPSVTITLWHDAQSQTDTHMELYFFESLDDSIVFSSSLRKPKSERHKSILELRYLSDAYLKKNKKKQLTFATCASSIYFVALHAPHKTYTMSTGEVGIDDVLRLKVNKDGSLGYMRTTKTAQERIGWKDG